MDTFWMLLGLAVVFLFGFFTGWYTDDHRWQRLVDDTSKQRRPDEG